MDDVQNWTAVLSENRNRELRGYIIVGQEDRTIQQENVHILADILTSDGIPTELEEIPDVDHDFSEEYAESLLRGINFITAE